MAVVSAPAKLIADTLSASAPSYSPTGAGVSDGGAKKFGELLGSMSKEAKKELQSQHNGARGTRPDFSSGMTELFAARLGENADKILADAVAAGFIDGTPVTGHFDPELILQGDFVRSQLAQDELGEATTDGEPSDFSQFLDTDVEELAPTDSGTPVALASTMLEIAAQQRTMLADQATTEDQALPVGPDASAASAQADLTVDDINVRASVEGQTAASKMANKAMAVDARNAAFISQMKLVEGGVVPVTKEELAEMLAIVDEKFELPPDDAGKLPPEIENLFKDADRRREMMSALDRRNDGQKADKKGDAAQPAHKTRIATIPGDDIAAEREKIAARAANAASLASGLRDLLRESNTPPIKAEANASPENGALYLLDRTDAFGDGLKTMVQFMRNDNSTSAQMVVEPPALGRIDVNLQATASGIEAVIKVENETLRQMVVGQIENLKNSLQAQGIHVSGLAVDIRSRDERERQGMHEQAAKKNKKIGGVSFSEDVDEETRLVRLDLEKGLLHWIA